MVRRFSKARSPVETGALNQKCVKTRPEEIEAITRFNGVPVLALKSDQYASQKADRDKTDQTGGAMLNFQTVRNKEMTFAELVAGLTIDDLRELTNELADTMLRLIEGCTDADVVFEPVDPGADDPFAATPEEVHMAWTLGHVIVHTTASAEESAAVAAELARGVEYRGRSRYEVPWPEMRTSAGCRQRLEESRRMGLSSLEMWPAAPHLDNAYEIWPDRPKVNAIGRYVLGLMHAEDHWGQIREIVRQARAESGKEG
jgi:hypothetical protein